MDLHIRFLLIAWLRCVEGVYLNKKNKEKDVKRKERQ
jgi:hypothetical protein